MASDLATKPCTPHALIVEDDADLASAIGKLFLVVQWDYTKVETVKAALAAINGRTFDFCIIDLGLPDGDGTEVLAELRRLNPALPVTVMSGKPLCELGDVERYRPTQFLHKPFSKEAFLAITRVATDRARDKS